MILKKVKIQNLKDPIFLCALYCYPVKAGT